MKPVPPPPQSPDEAMSFVKAFVRSIAPASLIDEQAFKIIGEPAERVEIMLAALRHQVADGMASCNPAPSRSKIFGISLAFVELVRERVIELTYNKGRA